MVGQEGVVADASSCSPGLGDTPRKNNAIAEMERTE